MFGKAERLAGGYANLPWASLDIWLPGIEAGSPALPADSLQSEVVS